MKPSAPWLAILLAACTPWASAESLSSSASIGLRVAVPRVLMLKVEAQPEAVVVTADDVARGEVVVRGARVLVLSNDRRGYRLAAESMHPAFSAVEVHGLSADLPSASRSPAQAVPVEFRLKLSPSAIPGEYRWPLRLGVSHP